MNDTLDAQMLTLERDLDDFRSRANPGVRALAIPDYARAIRREHQNENVPDQFLPAGYLPKVDAEAASRYDDEARELSKSIADRVPLLRTDVTTRIADARRLRSEAERINPDTGHSTWINAALLDAFTEQREEAWLDKHEGDEAAVLVRYEAADERRDSSLMRLIERKWGLKATDGSVNSDNAARSPLRRAVIARQDARVPARLREALKTLDTFEATYAMPAPSVH
jgi:hypothetical protein